MCVALPTITWTRALISTGCYAVVYTSSMHINCTQNTGNKIHGYINPLLEKPHGKIHSLVDILEPIITEHSQESV